MNIFPNLNIVSYSNTYDWYTRSNQYNTVSSLINSNAISSNNYPKIGCTHGCGNQKFIMYSFYFRTDASLGSSGSSDSVSNGKKGRISNF